MPPIVAPSLLMLTALLWYIAGSERIGRMSPWVSSGLWIVGTLMMMAAVAVLVLFGIQPVFGDGA